MATIRLGRSFSPKRTKRLRVAASLATILVGLLVGCAREAPTKALHLRPATFSDLVGWENGGQAGALIALRGSCARLAKKSGDRPIGPGGIAGTFADWKSACADAEKTSPGDATARSYFEIHFQPFFAVAGEGAEGLFTGYFEPELRGSRYRSASYTVPVYRRPPELVLVDLGQFRDSLKGERIAGRVVSGRLRPFADRAAIDKGALANRQLEVAWVNDPIALFFMHIQGSGRIALDDGSVLRIGYDGHNGHNYVAIGRALVAEGALSREDVSLQSIRAWLSANPDRAAEVMSINPSYIFFREIQGPGPVGAMGVTLTPGHSIAIDRRFVPLGAPVWLDAEAPLDPTQRLRRLMVAQDTGGAIRGPIRGDVFWGRGKEAEERAGKMKSVGRYWLLLPKRVAERRLRASPSS